MTTPYYQDDAVTLYHGKALDVLRGLPDASVDCCVTSPPYFGLRDYGVDGQQGLETSPAEYVAGMVEVFAEVRRVLAADGTLWLNIGDSYSGSGKGAWGDATARDANRARVKETYVPTRAELPLAGATFDGLPAKNLMGIPWRTALALQDDGWILRNAIIWHKPNAMPTSVSDRMGNRYETVFLFSKSPRYWFDIDPLREPLKHPEAVGRAIKFGGNKASGYGNATYSGSVYEGDGEKGRQPGDVWTIPTQPFPGAHFAVMPAALAERAIQAGCKPGGTVLDPFSGSGTTGLAAARHGRKYVGIDLNAEYLDLSLKTRLAQPALIDFGTGA